MFIWRKTCPPSWFFRIPWPINFCLKNIITYAVLHTSDLMSGFWINKQIKMFQTLGILNVLILNRNVYATRRKAIYLAIGISLKGKLTRRPLHSNTMSGRIRALLCSRLYMYTWMSVAWFLTRIFAECYVNMSIKSQWHLSVNQDEMYMCISVIKLLIVIIYRNGITLYF